MPRKPKYSKEEVLQSAFEITRASGIGAVTAASVAANIGNYTGSSLFTHFDSIEEIRKEVAVMALREMAEYIMDCMNYTHSFKKLGLLWVEFAKKEPYLYRLLFRGDGLTDKSRLFREFEIIFQPIHRDIINYFDINDEEADKVINHCVIYANGIAEFMIDGYVGEISEETIGKNLSDICLGIVSLYRMRRNPLSEEEMERMIRSVNLMPIRKSGI